MFSLSKSIAWVGVLVLGTAINLSANAASLPEKELKADADKKIIIAATKQKPHELNLKLNQNDDLADPKHTAALSTVETPQIKLKTTKPLRIGRALGHVRVNIAKATDGLSRPKLSKKHITYWTDKSVTSYAAVINRRNKK